MWNGENRDWQDAVERRGAELRTEQARRRAFWADWKAQQTLAWAQRPARRGTTVADLPLLLEQWASPGRAPASVSACKNERYEWSCPLEREHVWSATVKDRAQKGSACPSCLRVGALSDVPALAGQLADPRDAGRALGSNELILWRHHTWAVNPEDGQWVPWAHEFTATPKDRFTQAHACRVCAGYLVDASTSLQRWHPSIAAELVGPDPNLLSCTDARADRVWRCPDGHEYPATTNNRVYGTGCPWCTSTTSRAQARLAAELSHVVGIRYPSARDPRLPDGVPDLGSMRVPAPEAMATQYPRRYAFEEVDILVDLPSGCVGIEYDGEAYHGTMFRDRRPEEERKEAVLGHLGIPLVRVREGKLPAINGPSVVSVPSSTRTHPFDLTVAVLEAIEHLVGEEVAGLADYRAAGLPVGAADAEQYLQAIRNTKKPRQKPERRPRQPRRPKDPLPVGGRQGKLVVISGPTQQVGREGKADAWVYVVRCDCGTERALGHWYLRHQNQQTCGSCRA
ncbi:zinc-ribbon domain-containing protein [Terrabacter sp. Ter38]|uniref:zinc-ribbon domain-containing protein n=1 Tax=Terrabacter sp. Ter38 TaxID=2926030 RepID=UPI00211761A4|nr:zinc-ribbon domain-containing protein [Terrabacter sp. Ter38]